MSTLGIWLGLRELRRDRRRSLLALVTLATLTWLAVTLAALTDTLDRDSTGVLRGSDADLVIFDADARRQLARSRVPQPLAASLLRVEGVREVGTLGLVPTSVALGGDRLRVTLVGFNARTPAEPSRIVDGRVPVDGEPRVAAVDVALADRGVALGDRLVLAGDREVEVVGVVDDASYLLQPTIWVPPETWAQARRRALPEAGWAESLAGASLVRVAEDADRAAVAARIVEEVGDLEVVTVREAIAAIPGVEVQRTLLGGLLAVNVAVLGLVAGLLFALLVTERRAVLATLAALGAPRRVLPVALLTQAIVAWALALLAGTVAALVLAGGLPETVPIRLRGSVLAALGVALLAAVLLGSLAALRRIMALDPVETLEEAPT